MAPCAGGHWILLNNPPDSRQSPGWRCPVLLGHMPLFPAGYELREEGGPLQPLLPKPRWLLWVEPWLSWLVVPLQEWVLSQRSAFSGEAGVLPALPKAQISWRTNVVCPNRVVACGEWLPGPGGGSEAPEHGTPSRGLAVPFWSFVPRPGISDGVSGSEYHPIDHGTPVPHCPPGEGLDEQSPPSGD